MTEKLTTELLSKCLEAFYSNAYNEDTSLTRDDFMIKLSVWFPEYILNKPTMSLDACECIVKSIDRLQTAENKRSLLLSIRQDELFILMASNLIWVLINSYVNDLDFNLVIDFEQVIKDKQTLDKVKTELINEHPELSDMFAGFSIDVFPGHCVSAMEYLEAIRDFLIKLS